MASEKTSRMDVRLTASQRELFEQASEIKGLTLTQWAIGHLIDASHKDIREASQTQLSSETFEEFVDLLDAPMPKEVRDLLAVDPKWA